MLQETSTALPAFQLVPEGVAGRVVLPKSPSLACDVLT